MQNAKTDTADRREPTITFLFFILTFLHLTFLHNIFIFLFSYLTFYFINLLYFRHILEEERSMSFFLYSCINNVPRKGTSKQIG